MEELSEADRAIVESALAKAWAEKLQGLNLESKETSLKEPRVSCYDLVELLSTPLEKLKQEDRDSLYPLSFAAYIQEVWLSEVPPQKPPTMDIVELLLGNEFGKVNELLAATSVQSPQRVLLKLQHIRVACSRLFGPQFRTHSKEVLSTQLIREIHQLGGPQLMEDPGNYRKHNVFIPEHTVSYCRHSKISVNLTALVTVVRLCMNEKARNDREKVQDMIKLGALFYSEFLRIRPFANGNGRTARLILNFILKDVVPIPFSLYLRDRKTYIRALQTADNPLSTPHDVGVYLLQCIFKNVSDVVYSSMEALEQVSKDEEAAQNVLDEQSSLLSI